MANQKSTPGADAAGDALQLIVDKALAHPKVGSHVGSGRHVNMPPTWDGQGACPPGWTQHAVSVWTKDTLTAWVPITDAQVALLQAAPAQALLSGAEQVTLAAAITARVTVDPEALGGSPKASAVSAQVEAAAIDEGKP
jgi:hypothetical protein